MYMYQEQYDLWGERDDKFDSSGVTDESIRYQMMKM